VLRAVTAAKPTASASANLIMPSERAYDFDALHAVTISNAGDDQLALLNQLRERALASVDDPNTTLAISEWSAEDGCPVDDWDAIAQGTPGLGYTVSHEAILSSLVMDPHPVFRTEVMCQNVPSLDEPVPPLAWSSYADPGPDHQGRRTPSLIMSRKPVRPVCVTQCRGLIRWSRRENRTGSAPRPAGPDCRRDNISVAVGLSYNRPSGGRRPLRRKQRNAASHPGLRSPTARCDDCSE
jgi:hypothetical protein